MKEKVKNNSKIIALCAILLALAYYSQQDGKVLKEDGTLSRNEFGKGSKEVDLILNAEGLEEDYPYELEIAEMRITEEDAKVYFRGAIAEIEESIYAEGDEPSHVEQNLNIQPRYVNGLVEADWRFLESSAVRYNGELVQEQIVAEGELVHVQAELSCCEYKEMYDFYIQIYPVKLTKTEKLIQNIRNAISKEDEKYHEDTLKLPEQVDGVQLHWAEPEDHLVLKVFLLEVIIFAALKILEKEKQKDAFKARQDSMRLDYSDIVSKLAILVGAGMSVRQAWDTICLRYIADRKNELVKEKPAYEEMLATSREMQDGGSERTAFQNFSERVGIGEFHRLARILVQSIQKGSKGICGMLEQEATDAFESRKLMARKLGEEASTKMMIPLMLMLGIVMAMIMVPAMMGVQM